MHGFQYKLNYERVRPLRTNAICIHIYVCIYMYAYVITGMKIISAYVSLRLALQLIAIEVQLTLQIIYECIVYMNYICV